jgi:serine O-acetyltransferase
MRQLRAICSLVTKERKTVFCNIRHDLAVYEGNWGCQGFWAMLVYRFGRWRYRFKQPLVRKPLSLLYKVLYKVVQVAAGIELPCEVPVGRNFRIDHFGGIIISGYARFGDNCIVRNGVTIGLKNLDEKTAPHIGHNVNIGAGAKVLGNISIGDNVDIGANAVVLKSVPEGCLAVGIPARIIFKEGEKS